MSTSAGQASIPETSEEDVVPEETDSKPNRSAQLLTPALSPSTHPVTPDSDVGPHSPPSNRNQYVSPTVIGETSGIQNLSLGEVKQSLAIPRDLQGADVQHGSDGSPAMTGGMTTGIETGALATAGDTAGTNYGPNLGFPFPNIRPIGTPSTASASNNSMTIPPATPGASAPMSRNVSSDRVPAPKSSSSPDAHGSRASRTGGPPPVTRPAVVEQKKSFLHRMFHHDDKKDHKEKHGDLSKLEMPKNANGWSGSGQPSPHSLRESPPTTPGTPDIIDSDNSRPPSRQSSFKGKRDGDVHAQMPQDARGNTSEGHSGGLMRRLSHRSASHGSQSDKKEEKMKPVALVGGAPVVVAKKEEAVGASGNKFTLKDLIGMGGEGGKMQRRGSEKGSVRGSSTKGSEHGGGDNGSTASLLKKYGVCDKAAIGKGATAVVRLAHKWDRREEKLYAVKEFRKRRKNETEKDYVKKLTSEFCISSTLHHPNIVETVDLVQDEQHHWCEVMEYCPGGDLYAAIKKGGMSSGEVECSFKQILLGISYLHNMGVAHRDIKPENLLLDGRGHVKITDFGVSDVFRMCWEKKTHLSKGLCGSEPYIAPELFDQKEYDARLVDIWAAAVVFYCMQFQELPWRVAKHSDSTFASYVAAYAPNPNTIGGSLAEKSGAPHPTPPPLNNLVPRECRTVIKHMLDPDPKTRWGIEEVLKDKWMMGINVCKEGEVNDHTHVSAGLEVVKI